MVKEKKKKKLQINPILLIMCAFAFAGGWFGADIMFALKEYFGETGIPRGVIVLFLMFMFVASIYLVSLIHETGHLVMGVLTGYEFVSFRVGSLTVVRENGKIVRKKFNIAGTGGQCIMIHKEVEHPEDIPFFWYHFGGVFFNFLTAMIALPIILLSRNPFVIVEFAILAGMSVFLGLLNIIPTNSMGVPNDGYNIVLLRKSPIDRVALYKVLLINAMQYSGVMLEQIPSHIITFSQEEKNCESGAGLRIIEANVWMNNRDFLTAENIYKELSESDNIPNVYKRECLCKLMFCMIMNGKSKEEIDTIYNQNLQQYIKVTGKMYVMRKRLMYAYYRFIEKDIEKATKEYELAKKMATTIHLRENMPLRWN